MGEELGLVRFNFVPEGMSRSGAQLDIDTKTQQATFHGVHCEKVSLEVSITFPACSITKFSDSVNQCSFPEVRAAHLADTKRIKQGASAVSSPVADLII